METHCYQRHYDSERVSSSTDISSALQIYIELEARIAHVIKNILCARVRTKFLIRVERVSRAYMLYWCEEKLRTIRLDDFLRVLVLVKK